MNKRHGLFTKKPIALGVTAAVLALTMNSASAKKFKWGDIDVTFDSTFSLGASWRVEDRDFNRIAKGSDYRFDWSNYNAIMHTVNPIQYPSSSEIWNAFDTGSYSANGDAANLNYDPGEAFSRLFKGTHELDINAGNYGFFTRITYFYDFEMMDSERPYQRHGLDQTFDPCADSKARDLSCSDIRLLDAFFYGDFMVMDHLFSIKVGRQVLNWGESTLISHGINNNPVDIARLRAPGAELKEAFVPVGMVSGSLEISEQLSIEAYVQYEFQETFLPTPGSYFSNNDFAGEGGYYNNVQLGFGGGPDISLQSTIDGVNSLYQMAGVLGIDTSTDEGLASLAGVYVGAFPRRTTLRIKGSAGEIKPDDALDQYGIKLSYFSPELNDTEFGLYYMNYHSNRPLFSGITSNFTTAALMADLTYIQDNTITIDNINNLQAFSKVMVEYPEDIQLFGMSFNTTVGETAIAGEISFRQDEPLQIDDVEILFSGMPEQLAQEGVPSALYREDLANISQLETPDPGKYILGYILSDTTQAQVTFSHLFGPRFGADNLVMAAELGWIRINDMPDENELRLNGPGTARSGFKEGTEGIKEAIHNGIETNPFPTKDAWGYRIVASAEFNNILAGINLSPRLVFSHDVDGITPDPLFLFVEERKSMALGFNFDYQSRWAANFTYNRFWGGEGTTNGFEDRDYVSFSVKYSI